MNKYILYIILYPHVFFLFLEIPGFLSGEECDAIINKTKEHGLFSSHVHMDPESIAHEEMIKKLIGITTIYL